jgi:hypothetical protein
MKMEEIRSIAKSNGVKASQLSRAELIESIQTNVTSLQLLCHWLRQQVRPG